MWPSVGVTMKIMGRTLMNNPKRRNVNAIKNEQTAQRMKKETYLGVWGCWFWKNPITRIAKKEKMTDNYESRNRNVSKNGTIKVHE